MERLLVDWRGDAELLRRYGHDATAAACELHARQVDAAMIAAPHVHAVIGGTSSLTIREVRLVWSFGVTDVRVYVPARGAATYIAKGLLINPDNSNLSRKMPPRIDAGRVPAHMRRGSAS